MKSLSLLKTKRSGKTAREKEVLLGLIEYYLETGKPVGSNTLKETGFEHLSSATIRNYYAKLEEEGYLHQPHLSGGRIPTEKAFRFYAHEYADQGIIESKHLKQIEKIKNLETREIYAMVRSAVEELSRMTGTATFISIPRFDRDFVVAIKVVPIDQERTLCILITDFGSIQPEILHTEQKLSTHAARRIENYLQARLMGQDPLENLGVEEESLAQRFYNEVMVRFLVSYSNYTDEDIIRAGLSKMLQYGEFREPIVLAEAMALFESSQSLRLLVRSAMSHQGVCCLIGEELLPFGAKTKHTSTVVLSYSIQNQVVGALGLVGPLRIPYRKMFGILIALRGALSHCLTRNLYKFKVTFRQSERFQILQPEDSLQRIAHQPIKMIETRKR